MFFLLNKCFAYKKHQIIFTNTHRLRSRLIGWRTQKRGHAPLFSLVHPISFPLHTPYFCHPHRSARMLVTVGADARIDRRGCSYRPTRMTFVDVSCCQTFTFAVSNLYFHYVKPLLLRFKTSLFTFYTLFFFPYLLLFSSISSAFLLCASSGCSP